MNYIWDPEKNRQNVARHGIAFEDAIKIFEGPTLEQADDRFDYRRSPRLLRWCANGIEITVIYTDVSNGVRRVISAWRAERHEREAYWNIIRQG